MINTFYRFEFKYHISRQLALILESELKHFGMKPDAYAQKTETKSYIVNSLYFDSLLMDDYFDKTGGFLERKKIRARIYEPFIKDSTVVWLEMKMKHDIAVRKERVSLTLPEWSLLQKSENYSKVAGLKDPEERRVFENIAFRIIGDNMRPQAVIRYERKPLVYRHVEEVRVTFDWNLETCRADNLGYNPVYSLFLPRDQVIMELKFQTLLPIWLRDIIGKFGLRRDAFSKYGYGLEELNRYISIPR